MANFTQIIQEINDDINTNGVGAITGAKLNEVLRDIIAAVNAEKQDPLTIDAAPTEDSTNPVQSGGVFTALNNLITNGCLFGGEVSPQEQIPHGNDHSYFYLAIKDGIYTNFSSSIELTNCIAIIFWDTNAQNWGFLEINYNVDYVDNELNGKQDVISDLATIRTGAAAGATAYQKPSGGIPKTDLASGVQTSLGKADTAFQKPSGGIPESDLSSDVQQALQKHFKGWYVSSSALPANPVVGDYAYVKGATSTDPAAIYECTTAGTWSDSGRTADTSNVQTFASSEEVNEVHIINDLITGGEHDVLSAEQGKKIGNVLNETIIDNVSTILSAGYINSSGTVSNSNYAVHTDFIQIEHNKQYYAFTKSSIAWYIAFYNTNSESGFLSSYAYDNITQEQNSIMIVIPSTALYMRVTLDNTAGAKVYTSLSQLYQGNIPNALSHIPNEYYIKKDGTGDYTNLVTALADLRNDETLKTIYIEGGEYDIYDEMGGQSFVDTIPSNVPSNDWPQYSNFVSHNTSIIGLGNVILKFHPSDSVPIEKMRVICPLAFRGSVSLENLTIEASNCRYCIHDECGGSYYNSVKTYKNIKLIKTGSGFAQAYGAGFSKNCTIKFDNCYFSSDSSPIWSVHDSVGGDYSTIEIDGCIFVGTTNNYQSLRFASLSGYSTGCKKVLISNCSLADGKILLDDSAGSINRYDLTLVKSGNPTINDISGLNPFTPTIIQ